MIDMVQIDMIQMEAFIGKNGAVDASLKKEGDMCSPIGTFGFGDLYYRPDRLNEIEKDIVDKSPLNKHPITKNCGWSDDVNDSAYNTYVKLPYDYSHEKLWMDRSVYDAFVVIDYNMNPVVKGKGSAIFMHILDDGIYTAGCVAFRREKFFNVLKNIKTTSKITIGGQK
jgi:L,D-peptidoglycan transpeptidase YkuD (ErfK/YbiS/YcfS/YnhG family)